MLSKVVITINIVSFIIMGYDKRQAKRKGRRIPEINLFLLAFFMGAGGMLVGMYTFRHKTKHLKFQIGIPLILLFNIFLIFFYVYLQ